MNIVYTRKISYLTNSENIKKIIFLSEREKKIIVNIHINPLNSSIPKINYQTLIINDHYIQPQLSISHSEAKKRETRIQGTHPFLFHRQSALESEVRKVNKQT